MDASLKLLPPWNGLSLPGLARSMGQFRKEETFFREWGDVRPELGRMAMTLSGAELDRRIRHFARQMVSLGLKDGERIGILSLPSCDFVVAVIGAMAAGLSPFILPLSLPIDRMAALCEEAGVCGLVAGPDMDEMMVATVARTIAARSFPIRAVACFGSAPEGVVSLDGWRDDELGNAPPEAIGQSPGLLTVDLVGAEQRVMVRSQLQLIADALAFTTTTQMKPRGTILNTLAAASAFQIASAIVAPLLVRAETRLLPLFSSASFTEMVRLGGHQPVIVLPAHLEAYLMDAQRAFGDSAMTMAFVHQANGATRSAAVARLPNQRIIDVTLIGERGTFQLARLKDGRRAPLPQNWRQPGPRIVDGDALLLKADITGEGTLSLTGYGAAALRRTGRALSPLRAEQREGRHSISRQCAA